MRDLIRRFSFNEALYVAGPIALALLLRVPRIGQYDNSYYTASVKSMLQGWSNFLYGSFDPAGLVTVDKPPLAFWVQAMPGALFGVNAWSVTLPQLVMGVASVPIVYFLLKRTFGRITGVVGALLIAVMPVSVVIDSRNEPDALVAFSLLLAAAFIVQAVRTSQWRWLILFSVAMAAGFNAKMLIAFVPLPVFIAYFMLGSKSPLKVTAVKAAVTIVVTALLSFSWIFIVALTPAEHRPHVGSTQDNSIWTLVFEYNGLRRFDGFRGVQRAPVPGATVVQRGQAVARPLPTNSRANPRGMAPGDATLNCIRQNFAQGYSSSLAPGPGLPPCPSADSGALQSQSSRSAFDLFRTPLANQFGWLLPLGLIMAIVGLSSVLAPRVYRHLKILLEHVKESEEAAQILMWVGWLLIALLVFGAANATYTHPYYLVAVTAPLAVVTAIGVGKVFNGIRKIRHFAWLLAGAITAGYFLQLAYAFDLASEAAILLSLFIGLVGLVLTGNGLRLRQNVQPLTAYGLALIVAACLVIPSFTAFDSGGRVVSGPVVGRTPYAPVGLGGRSTRLGTQRAPDFEYGRLIEFLKGEQLVDEGQIVLATSRAREAAPFILEDIRAVSIGGFSGRDPVLSSERFAAIAEMGRIRYFLITEQRVLVRQPVGGGISGRLREDEGRDIREQVRGTWYDVSGIVGVQEGTLFANPVNSR